MCSIGKVTLFNQKSKYLSCQSLPYFPATLLSLTGTVTAVLLTAFFLSSVFLLAASSLLPAVFLLAAVLFLPAVFLLAAVLFSPSVFLLTAVLFSPAVFLLAAVLFLARFRAFSSARVAAILFANSLSTKHLLRLYSSLVMLSPG